MSIDIDRKRPPHTGKHFHDGEERLVDNQYVLNNLYVYNHCLGEGSIGKVYPCVYTGMARGEIKCAVKLPGTLMFKYITLNNEHKIITLDKKIKQEMSAYSVQRNDSLDDFSKEFKMAKLIFDPPGIQNKEIGAQILKAHFDMLKTSFSQIKAHRGYRNMLEYYHFIPEIPCIITELCQGSSDDLYKRGILSNSPDMIYYFLKQVISTIHYLSDVAGLAHIDLKFSNIFYKHEGRSMIFKLADYGGCAPLDKLWREDFKGSPGFMPPGSIQYTHGFPLWDSNAVDTYKVSLYELSAMILYLVLNQKGFAGSLGISYYFLYQKLNLDNYPMHICRFIVRHFFEVMQKNKDLYNYYHNSPLMQSAMVVLTSNPEAINKRNLLSIKKAIKSEKEAYAKYTGVSHNTRREDYHIALEGQELGQPIPRMGVPAPDQRLIGQRHRQPIARPTPLPRVNVQELRQPIVLMPPGPQQRFDGQVPSEFVPQMPPVLLQRFDGPELRQPAPQMHPGRGASKNQSGGCVCF